MGKTIETVITYLERQGWAHDMEREGTVVRSGLRGDNGAYPMVFMADEERSGVTLIMSAATSIPENRFPAVCEYLTRINWLLDYGSLQMDCNDGEVIFHVAVFLEEVPPTAAMVDHMVAAGISSVDSAYPGLMAVTFGDLSPAQAIDQVMAAGPLDEPTDGLPVA